MDASSLIEILFFYSALTLLALPIASWLFWCLETKSRKFKFLDANFRDMNWREYAWAVMLFSFACLTFLTLILRLQAYLPLNPQALPNTSWGVAFNTAASFVSNTNWQAYGGETTMSILSQSFGLAVQNFVSAAVGICVLAALIRGLRNRQTALLGNFWKDLRRVTFLFLLPLSVLLSILLIHQGVPQTYRSSVKAETYENNVFSEIALGPVASQVAIKQLGTNGGGYFNVNSAHPLENPTPLSNFLQVVSILLIPAACCHLFGLMIKDRRQGWSLYLVMLGTALVLTILTCYFEANPSEKFFPESISLEKSNDAIGGNMEGKETRFGITSSAIWAIATTAASNGSVNSMHDSFTALGGLFPMFLMQLGEVIFGGVGSGLYGMLAFVILAVFIAGLMVGRTPEYLGKKIDIFEIKMVSLVVLAPCLLVLLGVTLTIASGQGSPSTSNPGPHGFSQILYAYSSMGNNNGSAFGGFGSALPIHLWLGALIMLLSRFIIILFILALAGSLSVKNITPSSRGTLPTHNILFSTLLLVLILIVAGLTFIPAIVLGPIIESLV